MRNHTTVDPDTGRTSRFDADWDHLPIEYNCGVLMLAHNAEQRLEREKLELATSLTGGELMDAPWFYLVGKWSNGRAVGRNVHMLGDNMVWREGWFLGVSLDWYEGVPEYDETFSKDYDSTYRTMVSAGDHSLPCEELIDREGVWKLVAYHVGSGETQCYCADTTENDSKEKLNPCVLCEGSGFVYVGQTIEAIYKLVEAGE